MPDEQTSFGVYSVRHPPKAADTRGIPELKRNKRSPTWFTARLLFRAEIKGRRPRKIHTFEESMLLVSGTNEREAMEKAKKLARDKQHSYQNLYKEQVS